MIEHAKKDAFLAEAIAEGVSTAGSAELGIAGAQTPFLYTRVCTYARYALRAAANLSGAWETDTSRLHNEHVATELKNVPVPWALSKVWAHLNNSRFVAAISQTPERLHIMLHYPFFGTKTEVYHLNGIQQESKTIWGASLQQRSFVQSDGSIRAERYACSYHLSVLESRMLTSIRTFADRDRPTCPKAPK